MPSNVSISNLSRKLIRYGMLLFLLGLITGLAIPFLVNPRMGLSSHLEGLMNGMFLILLGLIWNYLRLSIRILRLTYFLALYATFTNWATTLLAAIWGAGAQLMPIAGGQFNGQAWQEGLIMFGLISLSASIIIVSLIVLWGLRGNASTE